MQIYNWQQSDWPDFRYNLSGVESLLLSFAEKSGHVSGILKSFPENLKVETLIDVMVAEAIKTSAIEGENLNREDVASSIKKNLGLTVDRKAIKDKIAEGMGRLLNDVRTTFAEPLTKEKLFAWHTMMMGGTTDIVVGAWRKGKEPMQVVSGALGKQKVHFEAPPSSHVPVEMNRFLQWFNSTAPGGKRELNKAPVRAAIAHLYFESIHPFEDGNGRMGRAIAEKALSQTMGWPVMLSLSKSIEARKQDYYNALQKAQRSNKITPWIQYFAQTVTEAQADAEEQVLFTLKKARFFERHRSVLNERQRRVVTRMFAEGPAGFKGGMNATKYIGITKTSKATATRDLQQLADAKILLPSGGGRSTHYHLNL